MAGPFYNAIKGTSSGAAGTGAFTPSAASAGYLAWSTVPVGWVGLVRFEDGSSWELQYSYWSGTTLSRAATTQFVTSSSGAALTLSSAATAELIADAAEVAPHPMVPRNQVHPIFGATTFSAWGIASPTVTGTAAAATLATTNYLTEQPRVLSTSATTANAQAAFANAVLQAAVSSSGRGGFEFVCRFGATQLPTAPRLLVGMATSTFVGQTVEPSAWTTGNIALAKDSTDTNLQLLVNSGGNAGTKTNTGIPLVANGWYEVTISVDPGATRVKMLLIRMDTGAIFYGETDTDTPFSGSTLLPLCVGGLSATIGTAFILAYGGYGIRTGAG